MHLSKETLLAIELATRRSYPNEMCGLVLLDGTFIDCENIASNPEKSFKIDPKTYLQHVDQVSYIVHSHTARNHLHAQTPSLADLQLREETGKLLLISAYDKGTYYEPIQIPAEKSQKYLGRPYIFGVSDCGVLIRDYYFFEFGIDIYLDLQLHISSKRQWEEALQQELAANDYRLIQESNPHRVEETANVNSLLDITKTANLQRGDILITSVLGFFNNHAMVYLGDGTVLNQAEVSKIEPLSLHVNKISKIYRHPTLMGAV